MKLFYNKSVLRSLSLLPERLSKRIRQKMRWFLSQVDVLHFAKPLENMLPATHRFRIGRYRILVAYRKEDGTMIVIKIDDRKDVYR